MGGFEISRHVSFDGSLLETIVGLERQIFSQPMTAESRLLEARGKTDLVILTALAEGFSCGYKIGFRHSHDRFYSWIGGIHPDYRGRGIAKALMLEQHQIIKDLGYKFVFTHTKNQYRNMLILNIKSGFDVIGVRQNLGSPDQSIILEKALL